jgi:hypothetical protein
VDKRRKPLKVLKAESHVFSKSGQILVAGFAWMLVLLAAIHRSESPVVFGLYSWRYAGLLAVFVGAACTISLAKPTLLDKLWQARAKIFVSGASLLLTICLAELGVRAVDAYGVSYYAAVTDYMLNMEADGNRVYRHKASSEQRYGSVTVTYNEHGLRDHPILPKGKGEYRVLALGDSIVFGWGVPQDQIFPLRLEQLLQSRLGGMVRVINTGVGGYNTVQEVAYFKHEGITLQPDLVVLTYVENDIDETPSHLIRDADAEAQSFLARAMRPLEKLWLYRLVQHAQDHGFHVRDDPRPMRSSDSKGWDDSISALDELVSMCRAHNVPLMIFYYRLKADTENPLLQDVVLHAQGVPVNDVAPWFAGHDMSALVVSKIDSHPNAEAHRLIAEHMAVDIQHFIVAPR